MTSSYPDFETSLRSLAIVGNFLSSFTKLEPEIRAFINIPARMVLTFLSYKDRDYIRTAANVLAVSSLFFFKNPYMAVFIDCAIEATRFWSHKDPGNREMTVGSTGNRFSRDAVPLKEFEDKVQALKYLGIKEESPTKETIHEAANKLIAIFQQRIGKATPVIGQQFQNGITNVERARDYLIATCK